jgi:hypothetical protein
MKPLSVEEAIKTITGDCSKNSDKLRFNRKKFNLLMTALANDVDFTTHIAKVVGDGYELTRIMPTKQFRLWCKKLLEKAGMDRTESKKVLSSDFEIDNVDGLYEFFASAIYMYIDECKSEFDLLPKEDFKGGIYLKHVPEKTRKNVKTYSPKDRSFLGEYDETIKAHKELKLGATIPKYLKIREKS